MKSLEIKSCNRCPHHDYTDGICGSATWCLKINKQILSKDMDKNFPTWCPLMETKSQLPTAEARGLVR
jgi:hypothetical protein